MPWAQTAVVQPANATFSSTNINNVDATKLAPGNSLLLAAQGLNIVATPPPPQVTAVFNNWPQLVQEAVRAALYSAVTSDPRVPVQFTWTPGAGHGAGIWTAAGAMTIRLTSP